MKSTVSGLIVAASTLLCACLGTEADGAVEVELGEVQGQSSPLSISGGEVPVPITAGGAPSWNGLYAELLAADALAMCWNSQSPGAKQPYPRPTSDPDKLIQYLYAKMQASLRTPPGTDTQSDYSAWISTRGNSSYNRDAATLTIPKSIDLSGTRSAAEYAMPATAALGIPAGAAADRARTSAQWYVANADLALCMAYKLREHMDSPFIAFATDVEVRRLLELAQERALTAVVNYSVLAKAFSATNLLGTDWTVNNGNMAVIPLRRWRDTMGAPVSTRLGEDFAVAIRLLVETTEMRADVLQRSPSAQAGFGTYDDTGETVVGDRMELLKALYGQIVRGYVEPVKRKAVTVSMSDPNVFRLLGLARRADALDIVVANDAVNIASNGQTLLRKVEESEREARCLDSGDSSPACYTVGVMEPLEDYLVYQEHGITHAHAETLVKAFLEIIFGRPPVANITTTTWNYGNYMFGPQTQKFRSRTFAFHLFGGLSYSGSLTSSPSSGTLHISKDFDVGMPMAEELQLGGMWLEQVPLRTFEVRQHPKQLGMNFRSAWTTNPVPEREFGAVAAMVLARESAVQMLGTGFYAAVKPALRLIDGAIGVRSVTMRSRHTTQAGTTTAACADWTDAGVTPASCQNLFRGTGSTLAYDFAAFTHPNDPATSVRYGLSKRNMISAIRDAKFSSFDGMTLANVPTQLPTKVTLASVTQDGRQTRTTNFSLNWNDYMGSSVMLSSTESGTEYFEPVQSFSFGSEQSPLAALIVSYGGSLNEIAERAWTPDPNDWSKPRYDAFGLPRSWVPAPDAALNGGAEGEESYQYWLRVAKAASEEATTAIQSAFDVMIAEQQDATALALTEAKSAGLALLTKQELCGATTECNFTLVDVPLTVPTCTNIVATACTAVREMVNKVMPTSVKLLSPVAAQLNRTAPDFTGLAGGKMEQVMLRQWAAARALRSTYEATVRAADTNAAAIAVAQQDAVAAEADRAAMVWDVVQSLADLIAEDAALAMELSQIENGFWADHNAANNALTRAKQDKEKLCGPAAQKAAEESAVTGGAKGAWVEWQDDGSGNKVPKRRTRSEGGTQYTGSVNLGPVYAYLEKCELAKHTLAEASRLQAASARRQADRARYLDLKRQAYGLTGLALQARFETIQPKYLAALGRSIQAVLQTYSSWASQATQLQTAVNTLLETANEVNGLLNSAYIELQRNSLDRALATVDIYQRYAIRRRYQSYDLWRARALADNARRLAVAARRSIEARFALNLSEMTANEPFVDAPRLWADDVYDTNLRPPAVLGTTAGPTDGGGVYANKLRDYVRNLELFVQGYAVERPSTRALADAEVIELPGPATLTSSPGDQVTPRFLDPESLAWAFYCPADNSWIGYPFTTVMVPEELVSPTEFPTGIVQTEFGPGDLKTACPGGTPATIARLTFALDPWGQIAKNGGGTVQYGERYNARWSRLAVNLVGTGIRDCVRAGDPTLCFSQPFVRYTFRHSGPGEVMDYEMSRRSIIMPTAVVEGGKALAIEEWLDPVSRGWNLPEIQAVTRHEFAGRPLGGGYELLLDLTQDLAVEQIKRIQILMLNDYWVRQN